ncbi:MAG TPA: hypothetical protein PLM58_07565, partial [Novosphingobium sp.]|nr:hypothetical protein [Novosphingobium sp.]
MWSKRWPATTDASQNAAMHRTWFFFYGTLSEDHDNPVNHAMLPLMEGSWRATVRGALRAVRGTDGWYPGCNSCIAFKPTGVAALSSP